MSVETVGTCITGRAPRYGKQLVVHMSRRHGGGWDTETNTGIIELVRGRALVSCEGEGNDGRLVIDLHSDDEDAAGFLADVIERHVVKFGIHDNLAVEWTRRESD